MKKRISNQSPLRDHLKRDDSFYAAGLRLLAHSDFEDVSVAEIAREAHSSVGSFYYRYPDKVTFLRDVIWRTFRELEGGLDRRLSGGGPSVAGGIRFPEFIADIAYDLSRLEVAGVIRAALKLGSTDDTALRAYETYRARVGEWATALFAAGKNAGSSNKRIRDGMQILFALIEDAILVPNSTPRIGAKKLSEVISDSILAYTGVSKTLRGSPKAAHKPKSRELKHERVVEESATPEPAPDSARKQPAVKRSTRRKIKLL